MQRVTRMCDLQPGEIGTVSSLNHKDAITRRLLELGLIEGSRVTCLGRSVWKDPTVYVICGAQIALRKEVSCGVLLKEVQPWRP